MSKGHPTGRATSAQVSQIGNILNPVFRELSQIAAQKVVEGRASWLQEEVKKLLVDNSLLNPFAKGRVKQAWFYPKGWAVPSVMEQIARLAKLFPGIDLSQAEALAKEVTVPDGADGIALIPKVSALGRIFGVADPYAKGYGQLLEKLFELIASNRDFYYRKGELTEKYLRLHAEVKELLAKLETDTKGDVLVLAFNFGNLYAGYSARNARWEALHNNQLPLGSVQISCLLLTMPDRLTAHEHLWIDCPGDEYDWDAVGEWSSCPCFYFRDGELKFHAYWSDGARGRFGSVSAFLGV